MSALNTTPVGSTDRQRAALTQQPGDAARGSRQPSPAAAMTPSSSVNIATAAGRYAGELRRARRAAADLPPAVRRPQPTRPPGQQQLTVADGTRRAPRLRELLPEHRGPRRLARRTTSTAARDRPRRRASSRQWPSSPPTGSRLPPAKTAAAKAPSPSRTPSNSPPKRRRSKVCSACSRDARTALTIGSSAEQVDHRGAVVVAERLDPAGRRIVVAAQQRTHDGDATVGARSPGQRDTGPR